jgi:hypothetical protein
MRDDVSRTPPFAEAIAARLSESPKGTLVVLDIGTGPYAVLALLAAEAGARKVYALEVNPDAARRARETIEAAGWSDVIQVLEGFSTSISLPEKADLVVSEIVGSIASEEGLHATIADAHARLVKRPERRDSWIPHTVETWAAPCSYASHSVLGPPRYDWGAIGEPLRLSCEDPTLLPLAAPRRIEDIAFTDGAPPPGALDATFVVSATQLEENEEACVSWLQERGVEAATARRHAHRAARSFSGLAMWPRLILRGEGEIVVDSRGPGTRGASAAPGGSSWQTVLPILEARPLTVDAGETLRTRLTVDLPEELEDPMWYTVEYA